MKSRKSAAGMMWLIITIVLLLIFLFVYSGLWTKLFGRGISDIQTKLDSAKDSDKDGVPDVYDKCIDSDQGKDYSIKGTVNGVTVQGSFEYTDRCSEDDSLIEYYCNSDGSYGKEIYNCPESCDDGVCLEKVFLSQEEEELERQNYLEEKLLVIVGSIGSVGTKKTIDINEVRELIFGSTFGNQDKSIEDSKSINDYYIKNSFNKVSLTGDVFGPYSIREGICDPYKILREIIIVTDKDIDFSKYGRIILVLSPNECDIDNGATIGKIRIPTSEGIIKAPVAWIFSLEFHIVAHEIGHTLGMNHANRMNCLSCESIEYGIFFDVMGDGLGHLNAPHKEEAGWIGDNTIITTEGEYLIKPLELKQKKGLIQQIKLPLKQKPSFYENATNLYYSLEFRQPIDYDKKINKGGQMFSGVLIHFSSVPSLPYVIQTNYINYDFGFDPLLQKGSTFKDSINDYKITLKEVNRKGALVKIGRYASED